MKAITIRANILLRAYHRLPQLISTPSTSNAFADVAKQIRATVVRRRLRMAVWRDGALSFEIAEFLGMLIGLESRCQSIGEKKNPAGKGPAVQERRY